MNNALWLEGWLVTATTETKAARTAEAVYAPLPSTCPKCGAWYPCRGAAASNRAGIVRDWYFARRHDHDVRHGLGADPLRMMMQLA